MALTKGIYSKGERIGMAEAKELREAYLQTVSGKRIVEVEGLGNIVLRFPNIDEEQKAEIVYSKEFTKLLDSDLKTEAEMEEIIEKRGIWTDAQKKEVERINKEIAKCQERLVKTEDEKKQQAEREKIIELISESANLLGKREALLDNTIERIAERAKTYYLIYLIATYEETGERVWKTYDEFVKFGEEHRDKMLQILVEWKALTSGIPSVFLEQLLGA